MALILDSGVLVAALMRNDRHHEACRDLVLATDEMLVVPTPVLPEVDYLVAPAGPAPMLGLLQDIREGRFAVEDLEFEDYSRAATLLETYADLDVGFVDAAILAIVERLGEPKLATLDHRHFSVMRPAHVEALELLPG